jgi:hypothetical protein
MARGKILLYWKFFPPTYYKNCGGKFFLCCPNGRVNGLPQDIKK